MTTRPSHTGPAEELTTLESSTGTYSGDDVDWDTSPIGSNASARDQWKQPVRVASTASVTVSTALNAGDTIDGVTLVAGDRVLLKDQSTASQNGIYVAGTTPERAADMDDDAEVMGALVYVIAGTANGGKAYKNTNTTLPTIGSTSLTFTEFGAGSSTFATPAIVLGSSAAAGAASTVIRSDSTIAAFDATSPTTQALGDSPVVGTAAFAAHRDHKHGMPTAAITTSGHTQATARLLGRTTASTGAIEEITVGTGLSLSAGSLTATGGASSLTVEEVDGSPTDSAVTKIVFPNGTLGIAAHVATYTPTAGGSLPTGRIPIQDRATGPGSNTNALALTLTSAPTNGNLLIACIDRDATGAISNITQTNVVWTQVATSGNGATPVVEIWKGVVSASASASLTINCATTTFMNAVISEWNGITGTLDQSATTSHVATSASKPIQTGSITPTNANALVIGAFSTESNATVFNKVVGAPTYAGSFQQMINTGCTCGAGYAFPGTNVIQMLSDGRGGGGSFMSSVIVSLT